ncbi:hypothetical protein [Mycolicibacterium nivoides]|uniref:hypothetical protein n=1 Tax=Mycolicibacterium nivoides TaxID=2487344 RepID=UPI003C3069B7
MERTEVCPRGTVNSHGPSVQVSSDTYPAGRLRAVVVCVGGGTSVVSGGGSGVVVTAAGVPVVSVVVAELCLSSLGNPALAMFSTMRNATIAARAVSARFFQLRLVGGVGLGIGFGFPFYSLVRYIRAEAASWGEGLTVVGS